MYPVDDVEKARKYPESGLYKVPLEHEMLREVGGKAMEMARWEMGFWGVVGETHGGGESGKFIRFLVLIGKDLGWAGGVG